MAMLYSTIEKHSALTYLNIKFPDDMDRILTINILKNKNLKTLEMRNYFPFEYKKENSVLENVKSFISTIFESKKLDPIELLTQALKENSTLTEFYSNPCCFKKTEVGAEFLKTLWNHRSLTHVSIPMRREDKNEEIDFSTLRNSKLAIIDFTGLTMTKPEYITYSIALASNRNILFSNQVTCTANKGTLNQERKFELSGKLIPHSSNLAMLKNWGSICIAIAFYRANSDNWFKESILSIIPSILKLWKEDCFTKKYKKYQR